MSIVVHLDTDATDTLWRPNNKNEITFRSVANLQRLSPFWIDIYTSTFSRDLKYRDIWIYSYNIRVERVETLAAVC
jgi:hypothetical protein